MRLPKFVDRVWSCLRLQMVKYLVSLLVRWTVRSARVSANDFLKMEREVDSDDFYVTYLVSVDFAGRDETTKVPTFFLILEDGCIESIFVWPNLEGLEFWGLQAYLEERYVGKSIRTMIPSFNLKTLDVWAKSDDLIESDKFTPELRAEFEEMEQKVWEEWWDEDY